MTGIREYLLPDLAATEALGLFIGRRAAAGDVLTLEGDLGCGKTTLTQAIGRGLEVPADQYITSPTFALLHEYGGRLPLYHMDLYRLAGEEEIEELGFDELLYGKGRGLTVVEWPERLGTLMPDQRLEIVLSFAEAAGESRRLQLIAHGSSYQRYLSFELPVQRRG